MLKIAIAEVLFYKKLIGRNTRTYLKKRILVQNAAAANIKPEVYIRYFEDLI